MLTMPHRGPKGDHAIVRCADEGVPIGAIARIFQRQRGEVIDILEDAKALGQIIDLPRHDWPNGTTREEREPCLRRPRLEEAEGLIFHLICHVRLTAKEAALLAALIVRPDATKAYLHHALYGDDIDAAEMKIVDVFVCKLRRKLTPLEIEIETVWGRGYRLPRPSIDAIRRVIAMAEAEDVRPILEAAE